MRDCLDAGCSSGKFFCGQKKKFGLNCQAVRDVRGKILDLSILYPGSTSDILAFEGSSLFQKLENGLLAPGLCLFGNTPISIHLTWQRHILRCQVVLKMPTTSIIHSSGSELNARLVC